MIISRTPLRISFAGGGTDLPGYYHKDSGHVVSTAINKYMYVTVNKRFDDSIRLSYSTTEIVDKVNQLKHELVREAMKLTGVTKGVEITTISDIPGQSGLGSSSTLTVGLLNALYAYKGKLKSAEELARQACKIEIDILKHPIGKQDQYIAAYGGIKHIQFNPDDGVFVEPILISRKKEKELEKNLVLLFTNKTRSANKILKKQKKYIDEEYEVYHDLKNIANNIKDCLFGKYPLKKFGHFLDLDWKAKKSLAKGISNHHIDVLYNKALRAGGLGGKILGAGGGGFLLLFAPQNKQKAIEKATKLRRIPFKLEAEGSKIIYVEE